MSKIFFSIIIPAYNAEKYIEKCIHSVLSQSYTDCEVIIIDDGSVDGTEEFCRKAAETAPFISVYRIPHSGAGAARNAGLRRASGEYVIYLDADDYWTNSFLLEHLHDKLLERKVDVVMFSDGQVYGGRTDSEEISKRPVSLRSKNITGCGMCTKCLCGTDRCWRPACNKCVRRSLLKDAGIVFQEGGLAEDIGPGCFSCSAG